MLCIVLVLNVLNVSTTCPGLYVVTIPWIVGFLSIKILGNFGMLLLLVEDSEH